MNIAYISVALVLPIIYLVIEQILEDPLCTRHCARCLGSLTEQNKKILSPQGLYSSRDTHKDSK